MKHWHHVAHMAQHAGKHGNNTAAGVLWIVCGFFLTPILIGVPMICYGIYKLCK